MKITIFTLVSGLFLMSANTYAQHVFVNDNQGKAVVEHKYENLIGSPYLYDTWDPGIVKLVNGSVLKDVDLKFDMVNDILLFKGKKGETLQFVEPVKEFTFSGPEKHKIFRAGFESTKNTAGNAFYEVLFDGNVKLLKRAKKVIIESKGYNSATVTKNVDLVEKYYYVDANGKISEFKSGKKQILGLFNNKAKEVEKLISDEHLDLKNDADLVKIFQYYNSTL
ncbi:hypothetical protein [Pedobacter antarcticus]|uniref:hypothetical protein n=1 Tax=Pedobacter antarcticus TaxID=34086 RepID=UPI001C574BC1|nr:hypothetical protein [Pedobacter antarcticus]